MFKLLFLLFATTLSMAELKTELNVVTYNILTPNFATKRTFTNSSEEALDTTKRFAKLTDKLQLQLSKNTIFCLQEVSIEWNAALTLFFKRNDYDFYCHNYGKGFSGYMGVGLALPKDMVLLDLVYKQVVTLKKWPKYASPSMQNKVKSWLTRRKLPTYPNWEYCKYRSNFVIGIAIKHPEETVVGTYHMPCAYSDPSTMVLHGCLCVNFLKELADKVGTDKIIFAGDFNSIPNTHCHKFLTTGSYDPTDFDKDFPPEDKWRPVSSILLKSAFKTVNADEPDYTTSTSSETPFRGCLDYIFHSDSVKVKSSDVVMTGPPPFPSLAEPSDHLLLKATFVLD